MISCWNEPDTAFVPSSCIDHGSGVFWSAIVCTLSVYYAFLFWYGTFFLLSIFALCSLCFETSSGSKCYIWHNQALAASGGSWCMQCGAESWNSHRNQSNSCEFSKSLSLIQCFLAFIMLVQCIIRISKSQLGLEDWRMQGPSGIAPWHYLKNVV